MTVLTPFVRRYAINSWMQDFDNLLGPIAQDLQHTSLPGDMHETKEHIIMSFDYPGLSEDDFKVTVNKDLLIIGGERKKVTTSDAADIHHFGRQYGKFQRTFKLPDTIDKEKIEADYRSGVLHVLLPKSEPRKNETLDVQVKSKNSVFDKLLSFK